MRCVNAFFLLVVTGAAAAFAAAPTTGPAPETADASDMSMTDMRIEKLKPVQILSMTQQTSPGDIAPAAVKLMGSLRDAILEAHVAPSGPSVLIFDAGAVASGKQDMTIEGGIPVRNANANVPGATVRQLDAVTAAVFVVNGANAATLEDAYQQMFKTVMEAGYQPTGEVRQHTLYFEAPDSPNNVMMIEIVLQK